MKGQVYKWLESLVERHKKNKFYTEKIQNKEFEPFLEEVGKAISDMLLQIPEPNKFLKRIEKETHKWLDNMENVNSTSFKAGVCYGVFLYCLLKKKGEVKPEYLA